ncbi:MAG: MATE family efflux transporter [Butyricicoccus sp.]
MKSNKKRMSIDMTHGPLFGKILLFVLPLIATNVMQMLFNTVDTIVVGRFAGYTSLAAVGSTAPIIMLFVNSFVAASVGVNVVIARYVGLRNHEKEITRTLHTAISVAIIGGLIMTVLGIGMANWMIRLSSVPEDTCAQALVYLRIYFLGTIFTVVYNFGAAALRAIGDTRRPMVFLMISGVVNVLLNLFFVIVLRMDVAGVALATVISQALSAAMVMGCLMREQGEIHFSWKNLCLDTKRLYEIAYIGVPSWLQAFLFSISNVVIQGAINAYDSIIVAGCSAGTSVESLLYLAMNAFAQAGQTFTSQNLGAGDMKRVKKVIRICLLCVLVWGSFQSGMAVLFAHPLISVFNSDPAVIEAGVFRILTVASLYTLYGVDDVLMGGIRGCGVSIAPMIINLLCTCVARLAWIWILDTSVVSVGWVYASYPITWVLLMVVLVPFWIHLRNKLSRQLTQEQTT